jgi:hypothetical protein
MQTHAIDQTEITAAPAPFREALAELVQIGMVIARMIGRVAEAEMAVAAAASVIVAEDALPVATSLAEAIEADRAASAAAEARRDAVGRTEAVAAAFTQVSRAIRRTVLLAERLDRGWARPVRADNQQSMVRRSIARKADGNRAEGLVDALRERLDSLDTPDDISGWSTEDLIRAICRDLGVDPVRMQPGQEAEALPKWRKPPFRSSPVAPPDSGRASRGPEPPSG